MSNYNCLSCGGTLPLDMPATTKAVGCRYCGQVNPNPNFVALAAPIATEKKTDSELPVSDTEAETKDQKVNVITLNETPLTTLFAVVLALAGVGLYIYFWFYPPNYWVYLVIALLLMLPMAPHYFVPARWEGVAKKATLLGQEKYTVYYGSSGVEIVTFFASYFFLVYFTYHLFASFIPVLDDAGGKEFLCGIIAFFGSMVGVWIIATVVQITSQAAGSIFSKK